MNDNTIATKLQAILDQVDDMKEALSLPASTPLTDVTAAVVTAAAGPTVTNGNLIFSAGASVEGSELQL